MTAEPAGPSGPRAAATLGGVVATIALVTALSRVIGFGRTWVLAQTVGTSCLGTAYTTANAVPNLVFEIVVGGALAGSVVPLLAGPLARGDLPRARQITSALYGWVLLVLVPAAVVVALASGPITGLLLGDGADSGCAARAVSDTAASMLVVFALQIPIYGLTVVAQGSLQAAHRFLAPALAPLLSSLVVIVAYLGYAALAGDTAGAAVGVTGPELVVLTWGTTLGVAVLLVSQLPAASRGRLLVRPSLGFPDGVVGKARALAVAGLVTVAAQWLAYGVSLRLVNDRGPEGAAVVYLLAWTVFLLPWAVLVFPLATGVFPRLSAMHEHGEHEDFARATAGLLRGSVLLAFLGAAGVAALAKPAAAFLVLGAPGRPSVEALAAALVGFAPGVVGFALIAVTGRVLYASHRGAVAGSVTMGGWLLVIGAAVWLTGRSSENGVVAAVATATSAGLLVAAVALVTLLGRSFGRSALAGLTRSSVAAVLSGGGAVVVGRLVADRFTWTSTGGALVAAVAAGLSVVVAFTAVVFVLDRSDLGALARRRPATTAPDC